MRNPPRIKWLRYRTIIGGIMQGHWKSRSSTAVHAAVVFTLVLVTLLLPDSFAAPPHVVASVPAGDAPPAGSGTKTTGPSVRALDGATLDTTN